MLAQTIVFEFLTETVARERWEGTIEYTFMAPLSRFTHLAVIGGASIAIGLALFTAGERYAKRNSKLKRSG